ncbi:hypothetical protein ALC62_12483 [Cyphomyrmex costatus]|uniref:Glycoprotein n=1 Tax=Cyphomyrmex costatus TaxID=456900 RepID=A0A151I640_9HYME|nr:hypothetical protein ALC62_16011 [Cyphomyrmex costatus]KYM96849.1 hypothetical protein ALC62_12483 [Cyphomyrmex costatus]
MRALELSSILILVLWTRVLVSGFTGYDCGTKGLNITTLSLLDIGDCDIDNIEPNQEEIYLQLLQTSDYDKTRALQCKLEIDRIIYHCGMHSHVSVVSGGRKEYMKELGADACRRLYDTGSVVLSSTIIDRIQKNATNWRSVTLAGTTGVDGRCHGAAYSDSYGEWDNVVVQASVKIITREFEATVKRSTGEVILPSGTRCTITERMCFDFDGTETYWRAIPDDHCRLDQYDVLYEGTANKLSPKFNLTSPVIYTVTAKDTTFALTKAGEMNLCGYRLLRTEHPKLLILEIHPSRTFKSKSKVSVNNLDIFTYVNSKFIYVERHIGTQLTRLYRDVMEQKCALEQQILRNALALASIAPDEMAHQITKSPGYTATVAGEVIHLIKCLPVECKLRHTDTCYTELPVSCRNVSSFLLPRSHIITRTAVPRDCGDVLPTMYQIDGTWFRITSRPIEALAPPTIQPLTKPAWKYVNLETLATSGIYSAEDLDRLKGHMMFPVERSSMINTIARGAMGQTIPPGSISMMNLMDEGTLNRLARSTGQRLWQGFVSFGSASAGVLAIFVIIRVVKLIIDTIINGYALHTVYGWSIHLLGALWSSVANLLLHFGRPTPPQKPTRSRTYILAGDALTEEQKFILATETQQEPTNSKSEDTGCNYNELREYLKTIDRKTSDC